jgi:hypothetical protein
MKLKYNTLGQIRELYISTSTYFEPYLEEGESIVDLDISLETNVSDCYIQDNTLVKIPDKPDLYSEFNWLTKQWELPIGYIEVARTDYKTIINNMAGDKILSNYPTYRQTNYNREPAAPATLEMNLWIDDIRAESNIATSSIDLATDLATIEGIVDGFKAYLASL